jgi:hypothetical protein
MSLATAMEEEIAGMKRTKLSTRVSRHFQRFGYRADSFRGHGTFSFSLLTVSYKKKLTWYPI